MNKIILTARVVKDIELRYTKNNKAVADLYLATNNSKEDTTFTKFTLFGKTAETCSEYCHKGDLIAIEGTIKNNNYEDKDGNKRYEHIFIGHRVEFLSSKGNYTKKEEKAENEAKNIKLDDNAFREFGEQIDEIPF